MPLFGERTEVQSESQKSLGKQENKLGGMSAKQQGKINIEGIYDTNPSEFRKLKDANEKATQRIINADYDSQGLDSQGNPYSTVTQEQRTSKKDVLAISNASYGNSLLEKVVNNTNALEYQNAVLKFQQQQVDLLTTIANSIVSIGKVIVTPEAAKQNGDAPEYEKKYSTMAKALGGADLATASTEGLMALWKKVDKNGYFELAKSMVGLVKDMVEDGKIKQMIKDNIKTKMLDILPYGLGAMITEWEADPVSFFQNKLNKMSFSANKLDRMASKGFESYNSITYRNTREIKDYSGKAFYSQKTEKTITEIIPEYLAEILAALRKDEAMLWDWKSDKFVSRSKLAIQEHKANAQKDYKNTFRENRGDMLDMFEDLFTDVGDKNEYLKHAMGTLFKPERNKQGRLVFKDPKMFDEFVKRFTEVYDEEAFQALAQRNVDYDAILNKMGFSPIKKEAMRPYLMAFHAIIYKNSQSGSFDIKDFGALLGEQRDNYNEGKNFFTNRHSGEGTLSKGGVATAKWLNKFMDKAQNLGAEGAELPELFSRLTMGEEDKIDSAVNSENTFINTNVVYINAANVVGGGGRVGGGKGRKGKGGSIPGGFTPFTPFTVNKKKYRTAEEIYENITQAADYNDADYGNAMRGAATGYSYLEGNVDAGEDIEKTASRKFKDVAEVFKKDDLSVLGNRGREIIDMLKMASTELDEKATAGQRVAVNAARMSAELEMAAFEYAAQVFGTFSRHGATREAYDMMDPRDRPKLNGILLENPSQLLEFITVDKATRKMQCDWPALCNKFHTVGVLDYKSFNDLVEADRREASPDVKGAGAEAGINIFRAVWQDPRLEGKAGMATGGLLGYMVGNVLKQKGIFKSPKAPLLLGGVMAGAALLPGVKKHMDMMFGAESQVADKHGNTNAQKAMAKIMNVVMPVVAGGAAGAGFYKMMSKLGPAGHVLGLMGFLPVAGVGAMMQKAMGNSLGEWLWGKKDKDDSKFKKFGKLLGSILPKSFKKFWKAKTNDFGPATHYANALREMLPKILAEHADKPQASKDKLTNTFNKVINFLTSLDEDDTDQEKQQNAVTSSRDTIEKAIDDFTQNKEQSDKWLKNVEQGYNDNLERSKDKAVDDPELAKQDYHTGVDNMISDLRARILKSESGEVTIGNQKINAETSKEDIYSAMKEELNIHSGDWAQLKETVTDAWKEVDTLRLEGATLNDIATKKEAYETALKSKDPLKIARAANDYINAYTGVAPEDYSTLGFKVQGLLQLKNSIYSIGENILKNGQPFNDVEKKQFNNWLKANAPEIYEMVTHKSGRESLGKNVADNFRKMFQGKQVVIDEQSALDYADAVQGFNQTASAILNSGNYRKVNAAVKNGRNDYSLGEAYSEDELKKVRDFIAKASTAPDDNITTGQGYRGVKSDRYIPEAYLNIRAVSSKNVWGMNDFADISIAGKSGSLVGCSVATMNNILHYLGIKEISQNSLAVHANRHSNSSGVKYSFFSTIANDLGLHYRILTAKANIFNETFFKDNGDDCAYAVLLNNYNGTGHFVFCAKPTKDGTITMIDPMGKGRKEKVSISDITLRATIIVQIAKGRLRSRPGNAAASNWISKTTGKVTDFGMMSDIVDEDDGIFSGMGRRRAKMGSRKRARREKSAADNIRNVTGILQNDSQRAGLKQVLEDLYSKMEEGQDKEDMSALIATLGLSMVSGANDKKHAKRIISLLRRIDKGSGKYTSVLNQLMNSKETTDAQEEQNKQEANIEAIKENTTKTAENTQGGNANGNNGTTKAAAGQSKKGLLKSLFGLGAGLIPKLLVSALGMGIAWKGLGFAGKIFGTGFKQFNRNTLHNMLDEEKEQTIDPETGEVVDNGHFRDYSKAINGTRSLIRWGKMALPVAKYSAKLGIKSAMYSIKHVGKIASTAGKLVGADKIPGLLKKAVNWLAQWMSDPNGSLGKRILKRGWDKFIMPVINGLKKIIEKKSGNIFKKAIQDRAKKTFGSFLKKLPGIGLIFNLGQAAVSLYQGYKHAGQLLKVNEDIVPTGTRILTAFVKMIYDVGPELLLNALKMTPAGFLGFAGEVLIEVLRLIFTWDDLVETFGIGKSLREAKADANKDTQNAARLEKKVDKEDKEEAEKADADSKEVDPKNKGREKVAEVTVSTLTSYRSPSGSSGSRGGGGAFGYSDSGSGSDRGGYAASSYGPTSASFSGGDIQFGAGDGGHIGIPWPYTLDESKKVFGWDAMSNWEKLKPIFVAVSKATGVPLDLLAANAYNESRFRPHAKNPRATAGGLFQFIDSTWNKYAQILKSQWGIQNPDKWNAVHNTLAGALMNRDNYKLLKPKLEKLGMPVNPGALYMGMFLGPGSSGGKAGAIPFFEHLKNNAAESVHSFFSGDVIKANPNLPKAGTLAGVWNWAQSHMGMNEDKIGPKIMADVRATPGVVIGMADGFKPVPAPVGNDAASVNNTSTANTSTGSGSDRSSTYDIGKDAKQTASETKNTGGVSNSKWSMMGEGDVKAKNPATRSGSDRSTAYDAPMKVESKKDNKPVTPATRSGSDRTAIYDAPIKSQSSNTKSGSEASAIMEALTKGAANQTQAIVVGLDQIYKSINKLIDVVKSNNTNTMRDAASTAGR